MAGELTFDDRAFRQGLGDALREMVDTDGVELLVDLAEVAVAYAASKAPRGATGGIVAGLGMRAGRDSQGPWVEVGVIDPPPSREDFYQEFGTIFDRPQPFMRPALATIAAGVGLAGGKARRKGSASSRAAARRAGLRRAIRSYRGGGKVTAAEARAASRVVSNRYRTNPRRRR